MHLKSLRIKGFKSFAKPVTINFSSGLSAIVGPNGTGKSNIVDAILWVLGEQNPRLLRGQNMQDVIFAGTEQLKPSPYAEVTLVFDNSEGLLPFEQSEISIKRILSKDGTSSYFLNEKPCRLLDVRDVISHLSLGAELPGIVPQNRVYDLINPNSADLKAIIEEASGVSYYRIRRESAVKKLVSAEDSLEKIRILNEEIERQLKPLKKQAEDYQRILKLKEELAELTIKKLVFELRKSKEIYESNAEEIELLKLEDKKVAEEIEDTLNKQRLLEKSKTENSHLMQQVERVQKLKDSLSNLKFLKMLVEEKGRNFLDKLSSLRNQLSYLTVEIAEARSSLERWQAEKVKLNNLKNQLSGGKVETEKKLSHLNEELSKKKKELSDLNAQYESQKLLVEKLSREVFEKNEKLRNLENRKSELSKEILTMRERLDEAEKEVISIEKVKSGKEKEESALTQKLEESSGKFSVLSDELKSLEENVKSIEAELLGKRKRLSLILSEIERSQKKFKTIFDFIKPEKDVLKLLQRLIPFGMPLYCIYQEEIENLTELPDCFIVVKRGAEEEDIKAFLKNAGKFESNYKEIPDYFYHPSGFYYRVSSHSNYFELYEEKQKLEKDTAELESSLDQLSQMVKKKRESLMQVENELSKAEKLMRELKENIQKSKNELSVYNERMEFYKAEIKRKEEELEKLKKSASVVSEEAKKLTENHLNAEKSLKELAASLEGFKKNYSKISEETGRLKNILKETESDLKRVEERLLESERELKNLENRISENAKLQINLRNAAESIEVYIGRINEVHRLLSSLIENVEIIISSYDRHKDIEAFLNEYNREMARLMEKLRGLYERMSKLEARTEILESQQVEIENRIEVLVKELEEKTRQPVDEVIARYHLDTLTDEIEEKINKIRRKIDASGEYNPFALRDYEMLKARSDELKRQAADIRSAVENINTIISEVDRRIREKFLRSVEELNSNLQQIFNHLMGGGKAFLSMENTEDNDEMRLNLKIELPGKKLRNVTLLSGGEKSIAALALILALEKTFKIPFLVLDEVEPALDEVNLKRLVDYIKSVSRKTQVIMVTHQPLTVKSADVIYGVSVDKEGSSQVYSLKVAEEVVYDN